MEADSFDCRKCQQRFCDEKGELWAPGPFDQPSKRQLEKSWGRVREYQGIDYEPWDILGEVHYVCPLPQRPEWWPQLWSSYLAFEAGHLPDAGGMRDQPAWFTKTMPEIASALEVARTAKRARKG